MISEGTYLETVVHRLFVICLTPQNSSLVDGFTMASYAKLSYPDAGAQPVYDFKDRCHHRAYKATSERGMRNPMKFNTN